ncbi:thioredoxin-disulfide reductase [Chloroflexota bacterium]
MDRKKEYDLIIIGGGPAGLAAAVYASRAMLGCLLIEKGLVGGQIANAERVDNYPAFPDGVNGIELGQLMNRQAEKYGLQTHIAEVNGIKLQGGTKAVKTTDGDFIARAVIVAGGAERNRLGIPGEKELIGRGVSYCATCDAPFFKEQAVAVIGGGDTAITEALHLAKYASGVTVVHRRSQLRAGKYLQEKVLSSPKIKFQWDAVAEAVEGENSVKGLRLSKVTTGEKIILEVSGVFVSVGSKPGTDYLKGLLALDATGHIVTNNRMETAVPGILAAGDIRSDSARQAITAAGDGATAAIYAEKYITG